MAQVPQQPVHAATGKAASGPRAGFGKRFLAAIIDGILVGIVASVLSSVLGGGGSFNEWNSTYQAINTLIGVAYFTYFEGGASGQTAGKRAMKIRVIDFSGGGPLGYGRAAGRYFARILSAIPLALGYFWMLWDNEKQTWHDKLTTAVVVPTDAYPVEKWP